MTNLGAHPPADPQPRWQSSRVIENDEFGRDHPTLSGAAVRSAYAPMWTAPMNVDEQLESRAYAYLVASDKNCVPYRIGPLTSYKHDTSLI